MTHIMTETLRKVS